MRIAGSRSAKMSRRFIQNEFASNPNLFPFVNNGPPSNLWTLKDHLPNNPASPSARPHA